MCEAIQSQYELISYSSSIVHSFSLLVFDLSSLLYNWLKPLLAFLSYNSIWMLCWKTFDRWISKKCLFFRLDPPVVVPVLPVPPTVGFHFSLSVARNSPTHYSRHNSLPSLLPGDSFQGDFQAIQAHSTRKIIATASPSDWSTPTSNPLAVSHLRALFVIEQCRISPFLANPCFRML